MSIQTPDFFTTKIGQTVGAYGRINRVFVGEAITLAAFKAQNGLPQMKVLGLPICTYIDDLQNWEQAKQIAIQMGDDAALGMTMRMMVQATGDEKKLLANGVKQIIQQS